MSLKRLIVLCVVLVLSIGFVFFLWFFFSPSLSSKKILRVMTYSSFVGVFGPGPHIQKEFEKICDCQVKWIKVPDSTLFAQRLSLRKDGFKTDVVMGLDQLSLGVMTKKLPWQKIQIKKNIFVSPAKDFLSDQFVPYDWSPMSFLSREKKEEMHLQDLLNEKLKNKISLPSPRTSTVGRQFYYWIWFVFKGKVDDFLRGLKDQLYGMSPSWSTSYALFQRGHVSLSFSYLSSLLYHQQQEQEDFHFVPFREGHPFQVEMAGVSGFCTQCGLARSFVNFLLTPKVQNILKEKNYMFPVTSLPLEDSAINSFLKVKFIEYNKLDSFLNDKEKWLSEWDDLMR